MEKIIFLSSVVAMSCMFLLVILKLSHVVLLLPHVLLKFSHVISTETSAGIRKTACALLGLQRYA